MAGRKRMLYSQFFWLMVYTEFKVKEKSVSRGHLVVGQEETWLGSSGEHLLLGVCFSASGGSSHINIHSQPFSLGK